ncbi:MAG: fibronectin type III domain-containing protein [Nitrospira sp.]|nr:fibronectin type III domain-containing protein [Nitrospira sp.]
MSSKRCLEQREPLFGHTNRSIGLIRQTIQSLSTHTVRSAVTGIVASISLFFTACGTGNEQGLMTSSLSATGAAVTLAWDPVADPTVIGYYIHYGKQSPNQVGSCTYEESQFVATPQGTVTDLDPNSTYYFAVSAYNGIHSPCSNEVQVTT